MPRHEKKVILFLVEGESDEISFEGLLKDFFSSYDIHVHIMRCDITIADNPAPSEILAKLKDPIDNFLSITKLLKSDILRVIHLVDMDGAFVTDDCIEYSEQEKVSYNEEKIFTKNPESIRRRNIVKSAVLKKLCSTNTVYADLPYEIYYLSRNLEHVLHNRIENLSNTQKAMLSDEVDERFENRLKDFLAFISDKTFAVTGSYKDTWNFIQQGNNSLKRYSNVHLIFEK